MLKNLSYLLTIITLVVSCAKERPVQTDPNGDPNIIPVSNISGVEFEISTLQSENGNSVISSANEVNVEGEDSGFNDVRLVSYNTNQENFENVPFFGRPGQNYKIKYELTSENLVVYKIAPLKDLAFHEIPVASREGQNYKVPLFSYTISLYKKVRVINSNNEETHILRDQPVFTLSEASHVKVNWNSREPLKDETLENVFPSDIFNGEWFYAATVVSASPEKANSIGRDVSMDFRARSVSRIKFVKRTNGIAGLNLNVDENLDQSDDINLQETINIPTEYLDYRLKKEGATLLPEVEEIGDGHLEAKPYMERKFMKLDFPKTISAMTKPQRIPVRCQENSRGRVRSEGTASNIIQIGSNCYRVEPGLNKDDTIIENLEIANGYFSFVVYHPSDETRLRYSFRKAHDPLTGRVYFKDDQKTFGFFKTTKFAILNHRYEREDARQQLVKLNRFYPEDGKITYYFSKTTPEHMKNAGKLAIEAWDQAFKDAGTGIRVVLDTSRTVNLGDIRYNIINIVDTKDGARLLGYGPSIVDSDSGEIISATSNIYANPFRESWIGILRNYVRNKVGMFQSTNIGVADPEKMTFYNSFIDNVLVQADTTPRIDTERKTLLDDLGIEVKTPISNLREVKEDLLSKGLLNSSNAEMKEGIFHINSFDQNYKDAIKEIEETCGSELDDYIQELKSADSTHNEEELTVLNKCADVLLEKSVVATLVHELGHNFGLRHNFIASTDTENFIYKEDGTTPSKTSSTMDYQPGNVSELLTPGPYDVAAIRFGYAGKVQLANGEIKDVDQNESLTKQMEEKSIEIRKYKYCTDEDVTRVTPLCERHDDGTNPLEIVKNKIEAFNASYTLYGNRYDRANGPNSRLFGISQFSRTFIPLKLIYDQWRYYLSEYLGEGDKYLHRLSKRELKKKLKEMKEDTGKFGRYYAEYYEASELAYNFLKEIIFTPAKTCVARPKNGVQEDLILIDFEDVKEEVYKSTSTTIARCDDALAIPVFEGKKLDYVGEFGRYFEEQKHTLDISDIDFRKSDVIGYEPIRSFALVALTMRAPMMEHLAVDDFAPSFLDNPMYREEILNLTFDRVVNGLDSTRFGFNNTKREIFKLYFEREQSFLKQLTLSVVNGISVPGKLEESDARKKPFSPNITSNPNIIPEQGVVVTKFRHLYIFTRDTEAPELTSAEKLVKKREGLKEYIENFEKEHFTYTEPEVLAYLGFLMDDGAVPSLEDLKDDTFTFEKALVYHDKIVSFIDELEAADIDHMTKQANLLRAAYGEDLAILRMIANFLRNNNGGELIKLPVSQFMTKAKERFEALNPFQDDLIENILSEETVRERFKAAVPILNRNAQVREALAPFRPEMEAQLNMITEILLSL